MSITPFSHLSNCGCLEGKGKGEVDVKDLFTAPALKKLLPTSKSLFCPKLSKKFFASSEVSASGDES